MSDENKRPILVTLLAVFYLIVGLIMVFGAASVMIGGAVIEEAELGALGGAAFLIFGVVLLTMFYGFWKGWNLFWYIGIIVSVLTMVLGLYSVVTANLSGVLDILLGLIILLYLRSDKVKRFFLD